MSYLYSNKLLLVRAIYHFLETIAYFLFKIRSEAQGRRFLYFLFFVLQKEYFKQKIFSKIISGSNALRYSAAQKTLGRLDVFLMCAFLRLAFECFSCNLSLNNTKPMYDQLTATLNATWQTPYVAATNIHGLNLSLICKCFHGYHVGHDKTSK